MSVPYLLDDYCRKGHRYCACALLICAALVDLALPTRAYAQFTGNASATGQFESNSNVFDLNSGVGLPGNPSFRRSDTYFAYGAQFDGSYLWGRQELYATASAREYEYQHNTDLNHDDYKFDAGWLWKLGGILNGQFDVTRTHNMVPFYDLAGSVLALSLVTVTEQRETAQIGIKLNPNWTLQNSAYTSKAEQPIAGAPNLQLTQTSGTTSLEYLGFGGLTSGITAGYLSGDYSGTNGTANPSYNQTTAGVLANYKHSRTTFDGQLGYTRRTSGAGSDNTSGVTGAFAFTDRLTPKTSFTAKIDRAINSYLLNAGSEIDTDAGVQVSWQALYKLALTAGYTFSYRDFPRQGNNPVGSTRVDIQETANLGIDYNPQRWLQIRPYANIQTRRSTLIGGHYSQNVYGVSVTVKTPDRLHAR
jgi:hypothetical protein